MEKSVFEMIRTALCEGVCTILSVKIDPARFDCRVALPAVRCAEPARLHQDAELWAQKLDSLKEAFPPVLGAAAVAAVAGKNGHLLFLLTDAFYSAAVDHINQTLPPPRQDFFEEVPGYALARMRMLARKGGAGCPADPAIQQAFWLALGIEDAAPAQRRARVQTASDALLNMFAKRPPLVQHALRAQCGAVGEAAARLLSLY